MACLRAPRQRGSLLQPMTRGQTRASEQSVVRLQLVFVARRYAALDKRQHLTVAARVPKNARRAHYLSSGPMAPRDTTISV